MKLVKRLKLFNLIAFIASLFICFGFYKGFSNGANKGENLRLAETSKGVIGSLNKLIERQSQLISIYYNNIYKKNPDEPLPANVYISAGALVNINDNLIDPKFFYSDKDPSNYSNLINIITNDLKQNDITLPYKIINFESKPYIISLLPLKNDTYTNIILITAFSESILSSISKSTDSIASLDFGPFYDEKKLYTDTLLNEEFLFEDEGSKLSILIPFDSYDFSNVYLKITKNKHVHSIVIKNFLLFMALLLLLFIVVNLTVYILIKRSIIKRILKLNHSVKNITESNLILDLSINDRYNDEISDLTNEISKMSVRIASVSEEIRNLATYDSLTSLYNRRWLTDYSEYLIKNNTPFSLYFIDLDNFKKVNDNIGHDYGDKLLIRVSKRLNRLSSSNVKIGRFGGDEFVILNKNTIADDDIVAFSTEILNLISRTYRLKNFNFELKCSIGVSAYPIHGRNISTLFKNADISMYQGKKTLGNTCSIFSCDMVEDYALENNLVNALNNNEIITIFQPIYNVSTGILDTVEALARWKTESGLISPGEFIPLAKKTGLIVDLDKKMIQNSCILYRRYVNTFDSQLTISFNVSYGLLTSPDFLNFIITTADTYEVPYNKIKIEITEDETISDLAYIISILSNLNNKGFSVALDDFGVGYSSFNYIKKLPLTTIKIDRSLISNIETDEKTLVLVKDLIPLLKTLDLEVICEGIETLNQFKILKEFNCDKLQGFYFSKPVEETELFKLFSNTK